MRESSTKEIQIDDCDAVTFKALIRYLYTDDFSCIGAMIAGTHGDQPRSINSHDVTHRARNESLQKLLAVTHKYGLTRLQLWCEAELCECVCVDEVCSILCQAHLFGAKQLVDVCLGYIQQHYEAVIVTEKFGTLAKEWPEVMLKINLFM